MSPAGIRQIQSRGDSTHCMRRSDSKTLTLPTALLIMALMAGLPATGNATVKASRRSKAVRCPDETPTVGRYKNYSYGFTVTIPKGLKGFWNSARCVKDGKDCVCMGDHGRYIPIGADAYLEIMAEWPNEETRDEELNECRGFLVRLHRDHGEEIETLSQTDGELNGAPAMRLKLRYKDVKTGQVMIEDALICLGERQARPGVYTVILATPESTYAADEILLQRLLRSWRFRPTE